MVRNGITNFLLAVWIIVCAHNFYKAVTLDPGRVSCPSGETELKDVSYLSHFLKLLAC